MSNEANQSYTGQVYDLDFVEGNDWCQALLRQSPGAENIAVVTSDIRMQSILETAMIMSREVYVAYKAEGPPNKLIRVKLNIG